MRNPLTITLPVSDGAQSIPLEFLLIPAGSFRMGQRGGDPSAEPVHRVVIERDFYLGMFPVTQIEYRAMATACLSQLERIEGNKGVDPSHFKGDNRPVENVSWDDARCICESLTNSGRLPDGWRADLPTESQWEYACRAQTQTAWWCGDRKEDLAEVAWYGGNAGGETHRVGEKKRPNPFGLHDMHGNVWEWCLDYFDPRRYRKRLENSAGEALLKPSHVEFDEPNPTFVALAKMLMRFAEGDFAVESAERGYLSAYQRIAESRVENGNDEWKSDIDAAKFAIREGRWPEQAQSLARATQPVFQNTVDASSNADDPARVLRGGGCDSAAAYCRSAFRSWFAPGYRDWGVGFRLALVPSSGDRKQAGASGALSRSAP